MADPICRWRFVSRETIRELVSLLPKQEMPEALFKQHLQKACVTAEISYEDFTSTAYQLAVQLGLYYIDDNAIFHPRFNHDLTAGEADNYLQIAVRAYVAPNPYTKSLDSSQAPISIYDFITSRAQVAIAGGSPALDVKAQLETYFSDSLGNADALVALLSKSGSFKKINQKNVAYELICGANTDKESFFNRFGVVDSVQGIEAAKSNSTNLRDAFKAWMENVERLSDSTVHNYLDALDRVSEPIPAPPNVMHTAGWWAGIYSYVTQLPPPAKSFFQVGSVGELKLYYGAFDLLFADTVDYGSLDHTRYDECRKWAIGNGAKENRRSIKFGYIAYKKFLVWRAQWDIRSSRGSTCVGDKLSLALKIFCEMRKKAIWCADNTDGDTSKPMAGYVANLQLRKFLNDTPTQLKLAADDADNVRAWFKEYWDPDTGKNWLGDLLDTDLQRFGPYVCDMIQPSAHKPPRPPKFSLSLEAAVKTVIRPGENCFYDKRVHEALKFLGLMDGEFDPDFSDEDYQLAKSAQIVLKRRLKKLIPNGQIVEWDAAANPPAAKENNQEPDFLTVNEFLWFVKMHLNEIENKIVEKKMEPAKHKELPNAEKNKKPVVNMGDSDGVLLLRLRAALRTKPFAILAGHSGTGKSRMVRKLAYMTCNDEALRKDKDGVELKEPGNFKMIQVKPNWHDSCDLLGYYSELGKRYRASEFVKFICKAYAYPKTPFFVCLDEMNLAPVEQYFAEYLSAIESRKLQKVEILEGDPLSPKTVEGVTTDELVPKTAYVVKDETGEAFHADWVGCETPEAENWLKKYGLTIPRNLFVVGTVNMDESTNQFSRKVLDRAMTIEMTDADFDAFGKQPPELSFANVPYMGDAAVADLLAGKVQATTLETEQKNKLNALKSVLSSTSFAVAYRFANEYALYEEALKSTVALSVKPVEGDGGPQPLELSEPVEAADEAAAGSAGATAEATAETAAVTPGAATSAAAKKPAIPSAFDDMVLMKVLPRISGDEADVKRIFYEGPTPDKQNPRPNEAAPAENTLLKLLGPKKDTASVRKIKWILARGGSYLSFWP